MPIKTTLIQTTNVVTTNFLVTGAGWIYCGVLKARESKTNQYASKTLFQGKQ